VARSLSEDPALQARLDGIIERFLLDAIAPARSGIARLVERTVRSWDGETLADRIELEAGRDLQFIRINGSIVGALVGAPLWTRLAGRLGKHRALMVAAGAYALAQLSVLIAPEGLGYSILVMFLAGLPFSAASILLKAMMADVNDEVRLKTGHDQSGLLFSLLTGSIKIGSASAVIISTSLLASAGFDAKAGAANSEQALLTLSVIFAVVPALLAVCAILTLKGYRLDAASHAEVRRQLQDRDGMEDLALVMVGGSAASPSRPELEPALNAGLAIQTNTTPNPES
jgi:MFS family permease